jgi:Zn-dependent peptidase ImmA (M78 family)
MHHVPVEADPKDEASRFAAEFLMPAAEIRGELSNVTLPKAVALRSCWKNSMQSIIAHGHRLGVISDGQYEYLFRQLCAKG